MRKFDLIVVGGGTGLDIANTAAQQGYRVALIEKNMLGGTCLNRGCIPSKLLIHSANILQTIENAGTFGISVKSLSIDFEKVIGRVNKITDDESNKIKNGLLQVDNPLLYSEECHFVSEKEIAFTSRGEKGRSNKNPTNKNGKYDIKESIKADKILIAIGTVPKIPKIDGLAGSEFITSDEAIRLKEQPRTITFIGGGYIACELAHFFGSLGTKINIIQRNNRLIPNEDEEISEKFTQIFSKKYNVYLGSNTESISKVLGPNGSETFHVVAGKKMRKQK